MKLNKILMLSVGLSILCHLAFFSFSRYIRLEVAKTIVERTRRLFDIKLVPERSPKRPYKKIMEVKRFEDIIRFELPISQIEMFRHKERLDVRITKKIPAQPVLPEKVKPTDMKIEKELFKELVKKETEPKVIRVAVEDFKFDKEGRILVKKEDFLPQRYTVPVEFAKEMPGYTPHTVKPDKIDVEKADVRKFKVLQPTYAKPSYTYESLEEYLKAEVETYTDPIDHQRYFKITIVAGKDIEKLGIVPKEMVFLIDSSLSIQAQRMEEFKQGLMWCLNNLNPSDRFNIIAFKDRIERFKPSSVTWIASSADEARRFINLLSPTESTDVYKAFADVISLPAEIYPTYILLLSDGKPSLGITDTRKIIAMINKINKAKKAIFCYSGGARVNRYLLDFVAYRNRGWSEYVVHTSAIAEGLRSFYKKIKDPILTNLRFRFSGLKKDEVYPKSLPDFYKGAVFTLYGICTGVDEFSMQLVGESFGKTKAFIFADSFKKAPEGDKTIAREWAFNKIYYLIGQIPESKSEGRLITEIQTLSKRFNIVTPYSPRYR